MRITLINKNKKNINRGFTLVESLVAISILMVAIVSPMTIAQKGLNSATYSKDQMTASFLAQDVIEYIKNKRDQIGLRKDPNTANNIDGRDWLRDTTPNSNPLDCVSGCNIDTINGTISAVNLDPLKIYKDASGNFLYYALSGGGTGTVVSKFIRTATITFTNNNEARITVVVSWNNGDDRVTIENFIYNYWENL